MARLTKNWLLIFFADIFFCVISWAIFDQTILISAVFVLWIDMIIFALKKSEDRIMLFIYLVAFFAFLIGRQVLERYKLHRVYVTFSEEINKYAEGLLLISLLSLFAGYVFFSKVKGNSSSIKRQIEYDSDIYKIVRNISKYFFAATWFVAVFTSLREAFTVIQNGYLSSFLTNRSTNLFSVLLGEVASMCKVSFWVFLSTMPSKKESSRLLVMFLIYLVLSLGSGSRTEFVVNILLIFSYYISRNSINSGDRKWFGKREAVACAIIAPFLIVAMLFVSVFRGGGGNNLGNSFFSNIIEFFYSQGTSINFLKHARVYSSALPKNRVYMLGATITYLKTNPISQMLGLAPFAGSNNVQHALEGYSMSHTVSYFATKDMYLRGMGLGSSYIAEAFHDLGYFGVIFVNFVYSFLINKVINFKNKGIWSCTLVFVIMEGIMTAPRGATDEFIVRIITPSCFVAIAVIYLVSKQYYIMFKRHNKDDDKRCTY